MKSMILAVAAGTSLALCSFGADAMPAGTVSGASTAPQITLAAEGCGRGFERGPRGGCHPIRGAREVVVVPARPAVVVRRPAGCGVRVGPVAVRTGC